MEDLWTQSPEELEEAARIEAAFQYEKEQREIEFEKLMEYEYQLYLQSVNEYVHNAYMTAKDPG